jgi:hypothetical protein
MTMARYEALVKAVLATAEEGQFTRKSNSSSTAGSGSGTGKSITNKSRYTRKDWISNNDALAHQNYGPRGSWGTRGAYGGRGGNRGGAAGGRTYAADAVLAAGTAAGRISTQD